MDSYSDLFGVSREQNFIKTKKFVNMKNRLIEVSVSTDAGGNRCTDYFEVEHDTPEHEIELEAQEVAFNMISWYWKEVGNE